MHSISGKPGSKVIFLGFARNWRFVLLVGMLTAAAAVLAQQTVAPFFDPLASASEGGEIADAGQSAALVGVSSPSGVPDQAIVSLSAELPAHNAQVGKLPGDAGVSGGAATYTIPISVPPGRRGMQPALSLSYNSRAGNGVAGMGWSAEGLSAISRCSSNIEQDGTARAVDLSTSDKLCLDGQRLVQPLGRTARSTRPTRQRSTPLRESRNWVGR